jgi:hypothetical protein
MTQEPDRATSGGNGAAVQGAGVGEYRLCFVDGPWAYFADAEPTEMWGDDWNDAPHDCNAGTPYVREGQQVVRVAFDGDWTTVGQGAFGGYVKERWGWLCVERINRGEAPWMVQLNYGSLDTDPIRFEIHAGTTLGNFKLIVREAGGHVYEAHPEGGPQ